MRASSTPTWERSLNWRVLEGADGWVVVAHDPDAGRLLIARIGQGAQEPAEIGEYVLALLDARMRDGRLEALVRTQSGVAHICSAGAEVVTLPLIEGDSFGAAATFVAGSATAVVVSHWRGGTLHVTHVDLASGSVIDAAAPEVSRDDGGRSGLRVRSWTDGRARFDIVGDPDFGDRYGRVVCLTTSSDPPTMTTRVLPTGATEYWWRWGHAIELVRDFDADGVPDAVITAPGVAGGFVSVRSTRTGQHVCSLPIGCGWMIFGTSLGVSADGCYALLGGARPTEPELLDASAEIQLHELLPGREPRVVVWRKSGQ